MTPTVQASTATPAAPRKKSLFLRFVTIALIIFFLPIFVLAGTVVATGTVMVEVDEKSPEGVHLWIPVPMLLLDLAIAAAPMVIPPNELADMRAQVAPYADGLEAFGEALEDCPDGVLVEVDSASERVLIEKDGGKLRIDVRSADADVHVAVPVRIVSRALDLVV